MAENNALNQESAAFTINSAYTFPTVDGSAGQVLQTDGAGTVTWATEASSGEMIQQVFSSTNSYTAIAGVIPANDTIPQQTEGTQVLTATLTPSSASNYLLITYGYTGVLTSGNIVCGALFQDATANAFFVDFWNVDATATVHDINVEKSFRITAGTTSSTTIKLRIGVNAGTFYLNGDSVTRYYGGTSYATLRVEEIKA